MENSYRETLGITGKQNSIGSIKEKSTRTQKPPNRS